VQEPINPEHNLLLQLALCLDPSSPVVVRIALLLRRRGHCSDQRE